MFTACESPVDRLKRTEEALKENLNTENAESLENALSLSEFGRVSWQKPNVVIQKLGDLEGKTVADIGAGTGFFTFRLPYKAEKVIAIDIDPMMIQHLNSVILSHPKQDIASRLEVRLAEPDDPKLGIEEVDKILIINTVAYLPNLKKYLASLRKNLKDGGQLLIVDYKMKRLPNDLNLPKDERLYPDIIEEQLYELGYKNIVVDDTSLDYQYIISANL